VSLQTEFAREAIASRSEVTFPVESCKFACFSAWTGVDAEIIDIAGTPESPDGDVDASIPR
jgi:hypothetical protein